MANNLSTQPRWASTARSVQNRRKRSLLAVVSGITLGVSMTVGSGLSGLLPGLGLGAQASTALRGVAYVDLNQNGVQDTNSTPTLEDDEKGLAGVVVMAFLPDGSEAGRATTDANGAWTMTASGSAPYRIEFTNLPNLAYDGVLAGGTTVQFAGTGRTTVNFGGFGKVNALGELEAILTTPPAIGDRVWADLNGNGIQDAGEPGIPGVNLELYDRDFPTGITALTDGDGRYTFDKLNVNWEYRVVIPAGQAALASYELTTAFQGGKITVDSNGQVQPDGSVKALTPTRGYGENIHTYDFGYKPKRVSLGDKVFRDDNRNGIQDANEPGISGVKVTLLDANGNPVAGVQPQITGGDGAYLFTGLAPGTYRVKFEAPADLTLSPKKASGSNDSNDSDADANGVTDPVTLAPGQTNRDVDAGYYPKPKASLGDRVWLDSNKNGIQDAGEPGIQGVTVTLLDANGNPVAGVAPQPTNGNGDYLFTNLAPGTYKVQFTAPADFIGSPKDAGDDAADSDADPASGVTGEVTLAADENKRTVDAGFYPKTGSLGDKVFSDTNGNGIQDPGEPGIQGVGVQLLDKDCNPIAGRTTTTDANGAYSFGNLPAGTYGVQFTDAANRTYSPANIGGSDDTDSDADATGKVCNVTLAAGENKTNVDAGLIPAQPRLATLGDLVWFDNNGNNVYDAGVDSPVEGAFVELLDANGNPVPNRTTRTNAQGIYLFEQLTPGTYSVRVTRPANSNVVAVASNAGADDAVDSDGLPTANAAVVVSGTYTLNPGDDNRTVDFGWKNPPQDPPASIGNYVWLDNGDNVQGAGDTPVQNAKVELLNTQNGVIATQFTGADGLYLFTGLPAGTYRVRVTRPAGPAVTPVTANVGGDDALDSDGIPVGDGVSVVESGPYTLRAGDDNRTVDFGWKAPAAPTASLGDRVFSDNNRNGIQDPGEPGIQNARVTLLDSNGNEIPGVAPQLTNADGNYRFNNLPSGTYIVRFEAPAGSNLVRSPQDAGGDDTADSDASTETGRTRPVVLNVGDNLTVDAGFYTRPVGSIGDKVFNDLDGDGQQDSNETGVADVTVQLLDANCNPIANRTTTTDPEGKYRFDNLPAGTYGIQFTAPSGRSWTAANAGGNDAVDSDADSTGKVCDVALAEGQTKTDVDAGLLRAPVAKATLGNRLFEDRNGNGIQDTDDPGIPGANVDVFRVVNGSRVFVGRFRTGANGEWTTDATLEPGEYFAVYSLPAGYDGFTDDNADGSTEVNDSDADASGATNAVTLAAGENNPNLDAGVVRLLPATLGDRLFVDLNRNGRQDADEPSVVGARVDILQNGVVIRTAISGNDGLWSVTLPAGTYTVRYNLPPGFEGFTGKDAAGTNESNDSDVNPAGFSDPITLTSGQNNPNVDAGVVRAVPVPKATLGDRLFDDRNGNGIQDTGEPGLSGFTVQVLDSNGVVIRTAVTGADGRWLVTDLDPGTYRVLYQLPPGYDFSPATQGNDRGSDSDVDAQGLTGSVTLTAGQSNTTLDAGVVRRTPPATASIGDRLFEDLNGNGIQDSGEPGIEGATVQVLRNGVVVQTAITNAAGLWTVDGLAPGDYTVRYVPLPGFDFSPQDRGGNDTLDSDVNSNGNTGVVTLVGGQSNSTVDAGVVRRPTTTTTTPGATTTTTAAPGRAAVGDRLFVDANDNGVQDTGETGIEGVTVQVLRNGVVVGTAVTGPDGRWGVSGLEPGDYTIVYGLPSGFTFGKSNVGDDGLDSDVDSNGRVNVTLRAGEDNRTVDAAVVRTTPVTTPPIVINVPGPAPTTTAAPATTTPATTAPAATSCIGDKVFEGKANDKDGKGIPGLTVTLVRADGSTATAVTDANGNYRFCSLPAGTYTVRVNGPAGATNTYRLEGSVPSQSVVTVTVGRDNLDVDFGYEIPVVPTPTTVTPTVAGATVTPTTTPAPAPSQPVEVEFTGAETTRRGLQGLSLLLIGFGLVGLIRNRKERLD